MAEEATTTEATATGAPPPQPEANPAAAGWATAGAAASPAGKLAAPSPAQAALKAAQNPDRSQASAESVAPGSVAPSVQIKPVPMRLTPARGGLVGVMDKFADALAGTTRPEIWRDEEGNEFVYHPNLSRGEQWARIGAQLASGAAAGLAAGRGAGNMGRAGLAGVQTGQQIQQGRQDQEDKMKGEVRQDTIDRANLLTTKMNLTEQAWKAARLGVTSSQEDVKFGQEQIKYLTDNLHGEVIGRAAHPGDLAEILHVDPNLADNFVKKGIIVPVDTPDIAGHKGVTFIRMPTDAMKEMLPPGAKFQVYNPTTGKQEEHTASDPMTVGQQLGLNLKARTDELDVQNKQAEAKQKGAAAAHSDAETEAIKAKTPEEVKHLKAQTAAEYAQAGASNALANQRKGLNTPGAGAGAAAPVQTGNAAADAELGKWSAPIQASVLGMLTYDIDPKSFPTRASVKEPGQMDRETAVGIAKMIDPSYTEPKYGARKDTLDDYTKPSGKAGGAIIALNTAIHHLGELNEAITKLDNMHFTPANWFNNKFRLANDDPVIRQYTGPKTGVEDELAAVFKATGATDTSIRNWGENYSINDGPDSQHKSVEEALKLSAGRVGALYSGYKRSMGRDPDFSFLDQQSVEILRNLPGGKALLDMQANQVKPIAGQTRDVSVLGDMATPAQLRPTPQPPTAGAAPPGATKVVPGPDGKDHWTNDEGTVDLGIKQ